MRKYSLAALTCVTVLGLFGAGTALADKPADPGCFGQDRAFYIHGFQDSAAAPGASEWGALASDRAGTNGDLNRAYRDSAACGSVSD